MEEYHRDSLRELRRAEMQQLQERPARGSLFITLLIIALFLAAGGFYLKTTDRLPSFTTVQQRVVQWADELVSAVQQEPADDVQATVDNALAARDGAV